MKKKVTILDKIIPIVFWGIILALLITIPIVTSADDPPKPKKEIKEDTTKIDIKQMKELNKQMEIDNSLFDSLLMKIDTLKKKK
jgi:hypothetical protein